MSENINQEKVSEEMPENTREQENTPMASVFDKTGEDTLAGGEYVGSFDELLKSLGITPINQMEPGDIAPQEEPGEISFTEKTEEEYVPFGSDTYLMDMEKDQADKQQKKKFMQNFRVLSKKTGDRTLLEAVPTGDGTGNVADRVKMEEGEDIFDAVERAESIKKKGIFNAKGKSADKILDKANKKKKEEVLVKAKELAGVLTKKLSRQKIQFIILGILAGITVVLSFLPSLYNGEESPLTVLFGNGARVYGIINIVCLLLIVAAGYDRFISAFKALKSLKPDSNTGLLILSVFVLLHQIILLFTGKSAFYDIYLYNVYVVFAVAVSLYSESIKTKIALSNLSLVAKSTAIESVHPVENKADSDMLLKGVTSKKKGKALYCARADSINGLNGNMGKRPGEDKFYSFLHIGVLVAGIIAGVVIMIRNKDTAMFATAVVACICLCGPTLCEFARTLLLYNENNELIRQGAAVTSFQGIRIMENSSGVAMDASDIFLAKVTKFKAVRMSRMSVENSATLTAALLKDTGSLLAECFEGYEDSIDGDLPLAEELSYEQGLGYRGTVAGRDVIVGNRKMLLKNQLDAPSKQEERSYAGNKCCMYVAVDGELTATFLVSYEVLPNLRKAAVSFNKSGLVLLLTTADPCLTETLVSLKLGSDISRVKILDNDASELMDEYRLNRSMRQSNCLIASKTKFSLFALVVGAKLLYDNDKFILLMHVAGQCLAFAMLLAAVIVGVPTFLNPYVIAALQCIWSSLALLFVIKK